jgi:UDP-2,3-diacylglucosamine pyrophosphatase LpxH
MTRAASPTGHVRTLFLSDVHLGFRGCQADLLLNFLRTVKTERLVLVGDIVDLWSLRRSFYWPPAHQQVVRQILAIARSGTEVIYVPGNHDEGFRELCGGAFESIAVRREFIHETARGERYLVVHGDEFDGNVKFAGWLKWIGEHLYDFILWASRSVQDIRHRLGFGYWSLANWIKDQVPDARRYISRFEHAAAAAALKRGMDGVICGHIHHPGIRNVEGVLYCNDGDWVENCSMLYEDMSGYLRVGFHHMRSAETDVVRDTPVEAAGVTLDKAA